MEARLAKLEAKCEHIETQLGGIRDDVREIRGEVRHLLYGGIAGTAFLLAAFAGGFVLLNSGLQTLLSR